MLVRVRTFARIVKARGIMGAHGTTADSHRKDYYSGARASKHKERQMEAGDVGDRFVLPPANPPPTQPKPMVMGGRESKAAMRKKPHPNAALIKDLRDNELRACYRATFGTDPGQLGKDKMVAAFLDKKAPRARKPVNYAPDYDSASARSSMSPEPSPGLSVFKWSSWSEEPSPPAYLRAWH